MRRDAAFAYLDARRDSDDFQSAIETLDKFNKLIWS